MSGTAIFAAGQTTSAPFTLTPTGATGNQRISGLSFPASWVAGTVSFLVSNDGGQTYQQLYSPSGSLYTVTAASNCYIPVDRSIMATVTNLMIVSSVTQTASVSVTANVTDVSLPNIGTVAASSGGGGGSVPTGTPGDIANFGSGGALQDSGTLLSALARLASPVFTGIAKFAGRADGVLRLTGTATIPMTATHVSIRQTAAGTYTLPSAPMDGFQLRFKDALNNFSTYSATIAAGSGDSIDGAASFVMSNGPYESISLTYDATNKNWDIT